MNRTTKIEPESSYCTNPIKEDSEPKEKKEMVNHPDHYKGAKYECIDVMIENFGVEATMNFCLLNAFKYTWRNGKKDECIQEAKKTIWYLEKYIELAESIKNK